MSIQWVLAGLLGLFWGGLWAAFLQFHTKGQWLAQRRTWITVVVGVAGSIASIAVAVNSETLIGILWVFALSSLGVIVRSIYNEWRDDNG